VTRRAAAVFVLVGVGLLAVPALQGPLAFPVSYLVFGYFLAFWIAQATSWTVLSGFSGYFSFGQAAFFGVGVYTTADLMTQLGWNYFATLPVAGVMGALLGLGVGALAFRLGSLRGEIFALLTLIVALILATVARLSTFVDGGQGRTIPVPAYPEVAGDFQTLTYRLAVLVALAAVAAAYAIQHSRLGWGLFAIRDREDVAEGLGVPTFRYKMSAIAISGALAAVSGSVFALQIGFVTIGQVFGLTVPLLVIVMSVLGGRSHWLGPVLGATVVFTLQDRLTSLGLESYNQIILGTVLIVLVVFVGEGLYERGAGRWGWATGLFALTLVVLGVTGVTGGLLDAFAAALGVFVLALFIPHRWLPWSRSQPPTGPGESGEVAVPEEALR
jgi:branched-chain amino acid transport system permease protein